jgi:flagellar hook-associated protein 3 FlgL
MSLRSVNPYTSYQTMLDLQRAKDQLANLSEQISSGSKLNRLGDDPTGSALVLNFQDSVEKNNAYITQMNSATSFLQTTETTIASVNDSILRLLELAESGIGATTAASRAAIAPEVTGIKANLIALANTQSQGKYIFAGTQTTTVPFASTAAGASYAGDQSTIALNVSAGTSVGTNVPGDTLFFNGSAVAPPTATTGPGSAGDLFAQVTNLITGLNTNNTAMIQTASDNLKVIQGNIDNVRTDVGGRQSTLQALTSNMQSYNLTLQTIQSSYQDVDYPTAITEYSQTQMSQQAALSMLGKSKATLFDYLS